MYIYIETNPWVVLNLINAALEQKIVLNPVKGLDVMAFQESQDYSPKVMCGAVVLTF
ncbi:hypothetical protein SLEP1_g55509 [Rubroshorea leprosula]|uniref:Uncharacterized protein n=1 Tax=Rubroshorea leprosula TaxID=152421 RepID=A0AAV5MFP8_9ROSI|nr:hypothetical protein SLEP1_g55509 [Rubroshorea leprosula]